MTWTAKLEAWALAAVLIFAAGMGAGWMLWNPEKVKVQKVEPAAPQVVQGDGSTILERQPNPNAKPAQHLPRGAKLDRVVEVVIQPNQPIVEPLRPSDSDASIAVEPARPPCPPVRVDLSMVEMPDHSTRVIVSSPDGTVLRGMDIPVRAPPAPPKVLKWAAGAVYGSTACGDTAKGAFIDRDFAFIRTGAEVTQNTYSNLNRQGWEFRAKLGIRF